MVIPLLYITVLMLKGASCSAFYLFAFQLTHKDVIIKPLLGKTTLASDVKYVLISLAFVWFVTLDLRTILYN